MSTWDVVTAEESTAPSPGEVEWRLPAGDDLPEGWMLMRLGDVCKTGARSLSPQDFPDEVFEYYSIPAFQETGAPAFETGERILSNKLLVERRAVLFGKLNPRVLKVWMVNPTGSHRTIASTEFLPMLASDKAVPEYLFYLCQSGFVVQEAKRMVNGSTPSRQRVDPKSFYDITIPRPPLPEQRAIARALRAVQDAIQARRREVELERERKAALMQQLFTHGTRGESTKQTRFGLVPQSWRVVPLDECAYVQTGVAKGRDISGRRIVSVPYLRVANVQDGYLDLAEVKSIDLANDEVERYLLRSGDVLLTEGGDFDKLGRGFIWRGQVPTCVHQNHIFAVRADPDELRSEFLAYLIQSPYGKAYFLSVAHRTTNLASINSTKLKALPALLPEVSEQEEIVRVLDACDAQIAAQERELGLHQELFGCLLEELVTGRLSVNSGIGD